MLFLYFSVGTLLFDLMLLLLPIAALLINTISNSECWMLCISSCLPF